MHQRHVLYDDEDDDNDAESLPLDPQFQITAEVKCNVFQLFRIKHLLQWNSSNSRLLLCAIGDAATIFARTHILPPGQMPSAHVISGQSDEVFERSQHMRPDSKQQVSELYVHNDVAVCLHRKTMKQQFSVSWAQTVS